MITLQNETVYIFWRQHLFLTFSQLILIKNEGSGSKSQHIISEFVH